jgi:hypothetical protein
MTDQPVGVFSLVIGLLGTCGGVGEEGSIEKETACVKFASPDL